MLKKSVKCGLRAQAARHSEQDDKYIKFTAEGRDVLAHIEKENGKLNSDIRGLVHEEEHVVDLKAKRKLDAEIRGKKVQSNYMKNRHVELRVRAQNRTAIDGIHRKLASMKFWQAQEKLTIVCVDNEEYSKYARGYAEWSPENSDEAPSLSLFATGIPELRRIITAFPANGRWDTLKRHINDTWPCTLNSFDLSSSVTKAQRKLEVDEQMARTLESLDAIIDELFSGFDGEHMGPAKKQMAAKQKKWARAGVQYCEKFATAKRGDKQAIQATTHRPILSNKGSVFSSQVKGEFNVNKALPETPLRDIDVFLNDLQEATSQRSAQHSGHNIHDCALEPNGEHGYVAVAVQKVYEKAMKVKKKTATAHENQRSAGNRIREAEERTGKEIKGIFTEIQHEIDLACNKEEDNSEEGKAYRQQLRKIVAEAQAEIDNAIRPKLDEAVRTCKNLVAV
ncbi:hypothetical protein BU23DRAFT_573471 [Bimuria novae-zelandiae CBS 107.79]|uniref:Uncharacterized protein n=1 Tax=Bimuria novae-zelandiae CBS 107.79 TaxID=1447943 RepID=A0A6A5UPH4_9PLEO|nr:hypothetical protein BU23DRAFT_573471 [Bimuria novae-zelandiae CBS 107.79]